MNRRQFLGSGAATFLAGFARAHAAEPVKPAASTGRHSFELEEWTIADLRAAQESGRFTSHALVKKYLERIEEIDRRGPKLHAVIEVNPEALPIARALDRERKVSGPRSPLHGIPVLIKDNLVTQDAMSTTAGSLALLGAKARADSFVAQRLRAAGAVLLGKTNLSEWANFRSTRSTSGWSGRGGQTKNPYALDRNPSGSSSGSGAAVAANLCAVAVGTETDGSILSPSSVNGLVGIKPTLGLISRAGIIPIAHSQDTAGPMARTVTDAAILLTTLAGEDPRDPVTTGRHRPEDYTRFLTPNGLRGARIGVARKFFDLHPGAALVMENALACLREGGATLVDPADLPTHGKFGDAEFEVLLYEFKADLNAYLSGLGPESAVHSLGEVIEFNERNREREMPYFGQEIFLQAQAKGPLTESGYLSALAQCRRQARTEGIDAILSAHQLDALVAPTTGPAGVTDLLYGDRDTGGSTSPAAVAGYPSLTVPAGQVSGLPVGISFFGRAEAEPMLLRLAYGFEQATRVREAPRYRETLDPERLTAHPVKKPV